LLPLLRNVLFLTIAVMVVLVILSEIGINIGPLLAGAGIAGLAIGFGSQKLVQDVITGAFILFEDSVAVGDVVQVAGIGGLVEAISLRSIRLRDLSGNVHTIPFSSVATVTNMTKVYSYYLFDVGVAYRENVDEVIGVLRNIGAEMQEDAAFRTKILEPLEVLGVDSFADSAVIIKARIKTRPIEQWSVGREFNRRMKIKFDELGIEIPFPHRTIYMGELKDGTSPPLNLRTVDGSRPPASPVEPAPASTTAPGQVPSRAPSESGQAEQGDS
jgi:small conductance mechanosensitive channel